MTFDRSVSVITGPNGCGKTSILNVLGRHFGWNINFLSTPYVDSRKQKKIWTDVWSTLEADFDVPEVPLEVGSIEYSSGNVCKLLVPSLSTGQGAQYSLKYQNQQAVVGLHIPSHRPVSNYASIDNIPVNPQTNQQQFQQFQELLFQAYGSDHIRNPGRVMKQSLISLAVFGLGNEHVAPNHEYRAVFDGFQAILRNLLPADIGFQRLQVRVPDIVLVTDTGDFPLDAMSGGVGAIFGMAWQIHMFGVNQSNCTVIIDEPENHLHPSMQRSFLPSLARAFPTYRFIVSTHSPFVVTSMPDAAVYVLPFNEKRRIVSSKLDGLDLAASPNKILQEVLDVPTTLPLWVESRIATVLQKYGDQQGSPESVEKIFADLKEQGLERAFGTFLSRKDK